MIGANNHIYSLKTFLIGKQNGKPIKVKIKTPISEGKYKRGLSVIASHLVLSIKPPLACRKPSNKKMKHELKNRNGNQKFIFL